MSCPECGWRLSFTKVEGPIRNYGFIFAYCVHCGFVQKYVKESEGPENRVSADDTEKA